MEEVVQHKWQLITHEYDCRIGTGTTAYWKKN